MQERIICVGGIRNGFIAIYLSVFGSDKVFVPPKVAMLQYFKFVLLVLTRQLISENAIFMNIGKTILR